MGWAAESEAVTIYSAPLKEDTSVLLLLGFIFISMVDLPWIQRGGKDDKTYIKIMQRLPFSSKRCLLTHPHTQSHTRLYFISSIYKISRNKPMFGELKSSCYWSFLSSGFIFPSLFFCQAFNAVRSREEFCVLCSFSFLLNIIKAFIQGI